MSPRRPPRAWVGPAKPVDPEELIGPRGLAPEVLRGEDEFSEAISRGSPAPPDGDFITGVGHPERDRESDGDPDGERDDHRDRDDAAFFWSLLTPARQARILSVIDARLASVTVVLDRLVDPHNAAAILRTAEGLGLARAHLVPHDTADDGHAHRRVTQDAQKWIDVEHHKTGAACAAELKKRGFEVWAGHLDDRARLYTELPADRPVALLLGNEHEGPQPETLAACAGTFRIPMAGFTQSLNVSVAAGIALAHLTRARRAHLRSAGDLPAEERVQLRERFTLLAAKLARRVKHRRT